jgi:futalosine hydrolase
LQTTAIVIPTRLEAEILLASAADLKKTVLQGKSFFSGKLGNSEVAISLCGIGKTNAAHAAGLLFEHFKFASVFVVGVAGAYPESGLKIGDVAVGDAEIYGDEGLLTDSGFCTMENLGLPLVTADSENFYNEFPLFIPETLKDHKHNGRFVTVSTCSGTKKQGITAANRFNAICENMEGAAIAHVGLLNNVPVTEIRGISNIIEDRNRKPLDKSGLMLAADNAQKFFLERILDKT